MWMRAISDYVLLERFKETPLGRWLGTTLGRLARLACSGCLLVLLWGILAVPLLGVASAAHLTVLTPLLSLLALAAAWLVLFRRRQLADWWQRRQARQLARR